MKILVLFNPSKDKMFVTIKYLENTKSTKCCMYNVILGVLKTIKAFRHLLTLQTMKRDYTRHVSLKCVHIIPKIKVKESRAQRLV